MGAIFADVHVEDHDELCSGGDGNIVVEDWNQLWEGSDSSFRIAFAKEVLLEVVNAHPEAKELFHAVNIEDPNSGEFEAHSLRIINTFDLLVNLLQDRHALHEASLHLGHQHAARPGVVAKYFKTFGQELIKALAHLIDDFHFIAWKGCFKTLTKEIVGSIPE
uniref:Extracellular globin n=1 Tax=Haemadipsa zeylanica TaxID=73399 RepID=Q75ZP6_9ANNE|nr:globin M2 precursor [Haemadipsa zeylanica]